jgi:hypothetical protein
LAKHSEAGKGDTQRPTNQKAFEEGFDRIFGRRIMNQKMSSADLAEYELDKSTGEVIKVAK